MCDLKTAQGCFFSTVKEEAGQPGEGYGFDKAQKSLSRFSAALPFPENQLQGKLA